MKVPIITTILILSLCLLTASSPAPVPVPTPSAQTVTNPLDSGSLESDILTESNSFTKPDVFTQSDVSVFTKRAAMPRPVSVASWLDGKYYCETTGGSPHAQNVKWGAERLEELTLTECKQNNAFGSKCTKMDITQDAAIGICGPKGSFVMCPDAAWAATVVADNCRWGLLAGGWYEFNDRPGIRIIVYHA